MNYFWRMKKLFLFALGLTALGMWTSCESDFNVVAEPKDIPVVFGLLSQQDTQHYVRIEKAFVDENVNAIDLAQDPDQFYYDNIDVRIESFDNSGVANSYALSRVDGNTINLPKDPGVFAADPNYLYHFEAPLDASKKYRLVINNAADNKVVTAETEIVEEFEITTPFNNMTSFISFEKDREYKFRWRVNNGEVFDFAMNICYEEIDINDPTNVETKYVLWNIAQNIRHNGDGTLLIYVVPSESFYSFLRTELGAPPANKIRRMGFLDLIVKSGGDHLERYINFNNINAGITSSQTLPTYTNLSEGIGVFSSRYILKNSAYRLNATTLDYLQNGAENQFMQFKP